MQVDSKYLDDDGRPKRTGTIWTTSAHIITAVIGSGVLSLAWAIAQLGWIAGPSVLLMFALVSYFTASLLADCYRSGDPVSGKRNYTYMDAVRSNFGGVKVKICGLFQYLNLFGVGIGYTIATSISMMAIHKSNCFHKSGKKKGCHSSSNPYMIMFGGMQIVLSQIPGLSELWWLSTVAAIMSFTYSTIGLALSIAKIAGSGSFKGSLTGISVGPVSQTQKIWRSFQAIGDIAFSYSYSCILIEIQDTIKSPPPSEATTMKKSNLISTAVTTTLYMLCGCMGYAAAGDLAPGNLLTGFAFYNPFWLLDIANIAVVIHLLGGYQVCCQPIFAFVEKLAPKRFPESKFITREIKLQIPGFGPYNLSLFRLVWRTVFVFSTTIISMLVPFFNDVLGIIGALIFWPLVVYFPIEMYILQKKIEKWSTKWIFSKLLSLFCLVISILAGIGSVVGAALDLKAFRPFKVTY
ncbi:Amino acid permease [Melia azedarach]|uniref:Amino acid permease n=1 Tax=Melia azedarach TaxID=155640 RepID=A0ACC1XWB1_MELAZ|nr:Amino acid permease [Melia azedarach]